ncbi:MAG: hypothetical protein ACRCUQ_00595 [Alphaproteobacteria bacterium]
MRIFFFLFVCFVSSCRGGLVIQPLISSESSLEEFSKKKSCPLKPKKIKIQGLFGKIYIKPSASKELRLEYEGISDELANLINVIYYKPSDQQSRLNIDASGIKLKNSSQKTAILYRSASFGPFSQQAQALSVEQSKLIASDRVEIEKKEAANAIFHVHLPSSADEFELAATSFPIVAQFEKHFKGTLHLLANQPCKLVNSSITTIDASVMGEVSSLVLEKTYVEKLNARLVNGGAVRYINSSIRERDNVDVEVEVSGKLTYDFQELTLDAGKVNLALMIKNLGTGNSKKQPPKL